MKTAFHDLVMFNLKRIANGMNVPVEYLTEPAPEYISPIIERKTSMKFHRHITQIEKQAFNRFLISFSNGYSTQTSVACLLVQELSDAPVGTIWDVKDGEATERVKYSPCICRKPPYISGGRAACLNPHCSVNFYEAHQWNNRMESVKVILGL